MDVVNMPPRAYAVMAYCRMETMMKVMAVAASAAVMIACAGCRANDGDATGSNSALMNAGAPANITIDANAVEVDQFNGTVNDSMSADMGATGNMVPTDAAVADDLATANAFDNAAVESSGTELHDAQPRH